MLTKAFLPGDVGIGTVLVRDDGVRFKVLRVGKDGFSSRDKQGKFVRISHAELSQFALRSESYASPWVGHGYQVVSQETSEDDQDVFGAFHPE
jgi:hypothetical protein